MMYGKHWSAWLFSIVLRVYIAVTAVYLVLLHGALPSPKPMDQPVYPEENTPAGEDSYIDKKLEQHIIPNIRNLLPDRPYLTMGKMMGKLDNILEILKDPQLREPKAPKAKHSPKDNPQNTVVNHIYKKVLDTGRRSELRKEKIRHRCALMNITVDTYPIDEGRLFIDWQHKVVYCPIGKVGNTAWREKLIEMSQLAKRMRSNSTKQLPSSMNNNVLRSYDITALADLEPDEKQVVMKNFRTFTLFRDPLDRMISAYKQKYSKTSLISFITKLIGRSNQMNNCDFLPSIECCNPCAIDFDYIGHFDNFEEDSYYILRNFFKETTLKFHKARHATYTDKEVTKKALADVPIDLKKKLFEHFTVDMYLFSSDYFGL